MITIGVQMQDENFRKQDPFADVLRIPPEHAAVDKELLNWAGWASSRGGNIATSPMFRMFRSNMSRGGYGELTLAPPVESPRALAVERAVRVLPDVYRSLLRGWYVFKMPPMVICRRLALRPQSLQSTLYTARVMTINVMRKH